jgi:pimeloyl-ACP methyl ester carboxylesterase
VQVAAECFVVLTTQRRREFLNNDRLAFNCCTCLVTRIKTSFGGNMGVSSCHSAARWLATTLLAALLSACASQPRDQVRVAIGSGPSEYQAARSYAALYVPYAMMATAAYSDPAVLNAEHCPDPAKLVNRALAKDEADFAFHKRVHSWIANLQVRKWECQFGVVGSLPCPPRNPQCKLIGGLEFHVWRRVDNGCREVAIAFRGTDRNDLGDWQSNFRWLHRLAPRFDQYDQVRENIGMIVRRIEASGCSSPNARFVAVGHSLGGGLAEQVGYAHPRIRYVYAFDPSPVTGFFDVSALLRAAYNADHGIDRAYESGEILSLPRHFIEDIYPPSTCDPRVRIVRFNLLSGSPVEQHSMEGLTENLRFSAAMRGQPLRPVEGYNAAARCSERPART